MSVVTGNHSSLLRSCLILMGVILAACCVVFKIPATLLIGDGQHQRPLKIGRNPPSVSATTGGGALAYSTAPHKYTASSLSSHSPPAFSYARRMLDLSSGNGGHEDNNNEATSEAGNRNYDDSPYLVTIFGMDAEDEKLRMMHFLQHYVDKLGVLPERCIFVLHSRHGEKAIAQGRRLLASRGIEPKRVLMKQPFDVIAATTLVRELLNETGVATAEQWVIRVDSDELLPFPDAEEMKRTWRERSPAGCNFFLLNLVDRIAADGELPHILPHDVGGTMFEQFPNHCSVTKDILHGAHLKISMHAGTMRTGPGHHNYDQVSSLEKAHSCHNNLPYLDVSHFKWVSSVRQRLEVRQKEYEALGYYWSAESKRVLQYLTENHSRFEVEKYCKKL
eukprot:CAMPEP_0177767732 /NCGR_PEP_ID=MMETSP0491_2-20121128/9300_1 /TAXON_ID=63592 /ORGANISM="Tetraselmis chuii, Strain PLY429" /LENGTH=390 /DNA_ID=CAMNT_0019284403 /DNA_START=196 /DNA_END=1368 /DNA_ORIENTATION=-